MSTDKDRPEAAVALPLVLIGCRSTRLEMCDNIATATQANDFSSAR